MPKLSRGNVFEIIESSRAELAIVFGHIGFNEMRQRWEAFSSQHAKLKGVHDPFSSLAKSPAQFSNGKWLWFVPEEENHGMTETHLASALDVVLSWASNQHIKCVATNGVANIDHTLDTTNNRQSDKQRAQFLISYATNAEQKYGINIELISLTDVFVSLL